MEDDKEKDIQMIGMEHGYQLGSLLNPKDSLASRIAVRRLINEQFKKYKECFLIGLDKRHVELENSRNEHALVQKRREGKVNYFLLRKSEPDIEI